MEKNTVNADKTVVYDLLPGEYPIPFLDEYNIWMLKGSTEVVHDKLIVSAILNHNKKFIHSNSLLGISDIHLLNRPYVEFTTGKNAGATRLIKPVENRPKDTLVLNCAFDHGIEVGDKFRISRIAITFFEGKMVVTAPSTLTVVYEVPQKK